jgi:hypothetical protein
VSSELQLRQWKQLGEDAEEENQSGLHHNYVSALELAVEKEISRAALLALE